MDFPEPTTPVDDRREVLLGYLDYFRGVLSGLSDDELRVSRLPSGWSPLELLKHLVNVERRWVVWGFLGRHLDDPWADHRENRWYVDPSEILDDLLAQLEAGAAVTRETVLARGLGDRGAPSDRWDGSDPPPLERVLLHLVQEYARHAGHIDVVRELADGTIGE